MLIQDSCLLRKEALIWHVCYIIYNTQNIHVNKHTIYTDFLYFCQVVDFQQSTIQKKIQGTCFKLQAMYFEIHALYFLLNALYGFDWRKNILKSRNKWIYATAILHDFDYFYSRFPLEHNSMRLIVLIRSFNPRRTQFILQDIETRGKSFNPRAHTGRDSFEDSEFFSFLGFNPRAHTGRDAVYDKKNLRACCFNPRAHTGRDLVFAFVRMPPAWGFNPRAHTGRDVNNSVVFPLGWQVSIHAPTRGATECGAKGGWIESVSIHAPTRGAT